MDRIGLISSLLAGMLANDAIADVNPQDVASALIKVETKAYKMDYEEIIFQDLFPIINYNDPTATSFIYYYLTEAGKAQLSRPDGKIAWVDAMLKSKQVPLYDGDVGYKYTFKELARASKLGTNLASIKPQTCVQASLSLAQEIAFYGDANRDLLGFFNNPDVPSIATVGGTAWSTKTAEEILNDINFLFLTAYKTTKQQEFKPGNKSVRLMLPTEHWGDIATKKISATSDMTILEFVVKKCKFLTSEDQVVSSAQIADTKMRIYHNDKEKLAFYWGHMIGFKAPQPRGLSLEVPADFSIGGLVIRKPLSCWDMDGI